MVMVMMMTVMVEGMSIFQDSFGDRCLVLSDIGRFQHSPSA